MLTKLYIGLRKTIILVVTYLDMQKKYRSKNISIILAHYKLAIY